MPKPRHAVATALAALTIAGLAACSGGGPVIKGETSESTAASTKTTPTPTPEPPAESGSRDNPLPAGTAAKHSDSSMWTYTVGATDSDAWPEISAANQFNQAPQEGSTYISVPVHVVADDIEAAKDGADPWASFRVDYVTAAGNTFEDTTCQGELPPPGGLNMLGTMYGGAQADFYACAAVPIADIPGGTWKISSMIDGNSSVFFAGA